MMLKTQFSSKVDLSGFGTELFNCYDYRAFSCDDMLSSNMAASIATKINIHLFKHLFTLLCVTVSPRTSPFVVQAYDDRERAWCV